MCGDRSRCRRTLFRHLSRRNLPKPKAPPGWRSNRIRNRPLKPLSRSSMFWCFQETMRNPYPWRSVTNVSEDDSFAEFCARLCAVMTNGWQHMLWRCHAETSLCFTTCHNHPQSTSNLHHTVCLIKSFETIQWDNEAMPAIFGRFPSWCASGWPGSALNSSRPVESARGVYTDPQRCWPWKERIQQKWSK